MKQSWLKGKINACEIEWLDEKLRHLENKQSNLDGDLNIVRWVSGALTDLLLRLAGWLGSSMIELKQEKLRYSSKLTRIDANAFTVNVRISQVERSIKNEQWKHAHILSYRHVLVLRCWAFLHGDVR